MIAPPASGSATNTPWNGGREVESGGRGCWAASPGARARRARRVRFMPARSRRPVVLLHRLQQRLRLLRGVGAGVLREELAEVVAQRALLARARLRLPRVVGLLQRLQLLRRR